MGAPAKAKALFGRAFKALRSVGWIIKRVLLCLVGLAVLAVLPVYENSLFGYAPVVCYVALIVLSGVYILLLKRSFSFEELSAFEDCQRGQTVDFIIRLTNKAPLFYPQVKVRFFISDLFGDMETVQESVVTLAPFEVRDFILELKFDHIGRYSAGLREIVISDPLGLFRTTVAGTHTCYVAVTPRVFEVNELETVTEETPDSLERVLSASENSMDYATVRDYVPGDPLKAIHWKLSARSENYLTRLYESYSNPCLDVVLDFCAPAGLDAEAMMRIYDALLETAFSLSNWADSCGMACHLVYRSRAGETRMLNSRMDAWSMLEACSDMPKISTDERVGEEAYELLEQMSRAQMSSNIALVSARIDEATMQAVTAAKRAKKHLMFFGLLPSRLTGRELADYVRPIRALQSFSIASYVLAGADELEEVTAHDA